MLFSNRGWESITSDDIPTLEQAYKSAPADDIQAQEEAGMRLAMAYLKVHDRKKAKELLTELSSRFADDESPVSHRSARVFKDLTISFLVAFSLVRQTMSLKPLFK